MGNSCICFRSRLICQRRVPEDPQILSIKNYHKSHPPQDTYYNDVERREIEKMLDFEKISPQTAKITSNIRCIEDAVIGKGTFGEVSRGYDPANKMYMAVKKVPRVQLPSNDKDIDDLTKEIKLLASIQHPNIVMYYGCKKLPKVLMIYMEYVDMGSLEDLIKQYGSFPEDVTAKYTEQILEGLDYLHSHGVIHRDIKTANILVDTKGAVKISDFGSARYITTPVESFKGTICYMAPEVR